MRLIFVARVSVAVVNGVNSFLYICMSVDIIMDKLRKYTNLEAQIRGILEGETDSVANMANVAALIHFEFGFWWTGFYLAKDGMLVLGPFQGPVACTRIPCGRGVCGTSWKKAESVVVPNVHEFPGHIACSSESLSEIVVPLKKDGEVMGVLDIDSREEATFDEIDRECLERIADILVQHI